MKIRELEAREDLASIVRETLEAALQAQHSRCFRVRPNGGTGQAWLLHRVLGACYTATASPEVRYYLRRSIQHSPRLWRAPAQWMLGVGMTHRTSMFLLGRRFLSVDPPIPNARHKLILLGNRRLRVCDLANRQARVFAKSGFGHDAVSEELAVRLHPDRPNTVPVLSHARDASWLDEPLVDGFALPRCPVWFPAVRLEREATQTLNDWLLRTAVSVAAGDYVNDLVGHIRSLSAVVEGRYRRQLPLTSMNAVLTLARVASTGRDVLLAHSHGDFQPGNIFIGRHDMRVFLVDWEHGGQRSFFYDFFVYSLRVRQGASLRAGIGRYVSAEKSSISPWLPISGRRRAAALFVLEDLIWALEEAVAEPINAPPGAVRRHLRELSAIARDLAL